MFVEIPPHVRVCDFVRKAKGRSSRKIQQEFEHIRKRYWGQRFWDRGYFSTTSGNITDDVIMRYLDRHTHKNGFSPSARSYRPRSVSHSGYHQSSLSDVDWVEQPFDSARALALPTARSGGLATVCSSQDGALADLRHKHMERRSGA